VTITTDLGDIEIWTITDPIPGRWSLSTSVEAELIDIFLDLIRVETRFSFTPSGVMPPFSKIQFQFDVLGSNGLPLKSYSDAQFALTVNATLVMPDGSVKTVPMTVTSPGSYTAFYPAEQAGLHAVSVSATTVSLGGAVTVIAQVPDAGNFTVSNATFNVNGFPTRDVLVGDPITLTAQYLDSDGSGISTSGLEVIMQIYRSDGSVAVDFPLSQQADGSYTITYRTEQEGQYQIVVQVKRETVVLEEQRSILFQVAPADLILLQLVPQLSAITHQATTGYLPKDNPWTVSVQATLFESGNPFNLESLANGQSPFKLSLIRKTDGIDSAAAITFAPVTDSPGLYHATFPKLETGEYTLQIRANEELLRPTPLRYHPTTLTLNASLQVNADPSVIVITSMIIMALIVIILIVIFLTMRRIKLSKFPATGTLQLMEYDYSTDMKTPLRTINLSRFKRNHIVIPGSKLPRQLNISKMEIKAGTPSHAQRKSVDVSLTFNDGSPIQRALLSPGYEYQIRADERSALSMVKDPDTFEY